MQKMMSLLTAEQISAIQGMKEEELKTALTKLKDAIYEKETPIVSDSTPETTTPVTEQTVFSDKDGIVIAPEEV